MFRGFETLCFETRVRPHRREKAARIELGTAEVRACFRTKVFAAADPLVSELRGS